MCHTHTTYVGFDADIDVGANVDAGADIGIDTTVSVNVNAGIGVDNAGIGVSADFGVNATSTLPLVWMPVSASGLLAVSMSTSK